MNVNYLNITKDEAYLIGYKLKLSPTERAILFEIASNGGASIEELMPLLSDGVSRGNIAVHINSINKKADSVSGRKLVLFENNKYIINPNM
ncbi:MAG: helix-turn-helix domain-containing protein [Ruminococcaceae bacterium]|nr:helix-turn-helix domain-containing protein [Oscillospiraceae bacterium]